MPYKDPKDQARYSAAYYRANRGRYLKNIAKSNAERRHRNAAVVLEAKSRPCADCGGTFPPECMDFDHVRGEKTCEVTSLVSAPASLERLLAEMDKCDVVCANCHRTRTKARGQWGARGARSMVG